jgi:hypothetical protein
LLKSIKILPNAATVTPATDSGIWNIQVTEFKFGQNSVSAIVESDRNKIINIKPRNNIERNGPNS